MLKHFFSLQNRLPAAVLVTLLVGNLLLGAVLYHQLKNMADTNQATVGKSLAYQLAYSVKTPMLHQDPLSLQVMASEIVQQPGVARAAIFDSNNQLLTEKQGEGTQPNSLVQYRAAITIESAVAGYAVVELQQNYYRQQGVSLFKIALAVLIFSTLAAVAVSWWFHHRYVGRIGALTAQLPKVGSGSLIADSDVLEQLEQQIAPLLTVQRPDNQEQGAEQKNCTLVGLKCCNFPQFKAQLSNSHLAELMSELDGLIASILKLYNGKLVSFSDNTLVLEFIGGADEEDDYPVRALYSTFALIKQLNEWRSSKGLEIDLAVVLSTKPLVTVNGDLMTRLLVEEHLQQLRQLQDKATAGDILLDKTTGNHPALDHIALLEPLSSGLEVFRCEGLETTADTLVVRQLALLSAVS